MILSDIEVLRIIEMRVKTKRIVGTLCRVPKPGTLHNAMKFLNIWNDGPFISNPYIELTDVVLYNMTPDLFRIFIEYVHHWAPQWTLEEIALIRRYARKYGYIVTRHKDRITFRTAGIRRVHTK